MVIPFSLMRLSRSEAADWIADAKLGRADLAGLLEGVGGWEGGATPFSVILCSLLEAAD